MNKEQQERAKIMMQATLDILNKCDQSPFVLNVMEVSAIWDNTECDGYCLKEELTELLEDIKQSEK